MQHVFVLESGVWRESHINGAAHQRTPVQSFLQDVEQVWIRACQVVHLRYSSSKVFKTLSGGSSRESLIRAVYPGTEKWFMVPEDKGSEDRHRDADEDHQVSLGDPLTFVNKRGTHLA